MVGELPTMGLENPGQLFSYVIGVGAPAGDYKSERDVSLVNFGHPIKCRCHCSCGIHLLL